MRAYAIVLAVAGLTTFAATPIARRAAGWVGAVAEPDDRHVHETATARLGGAAMFVGLLAGGLTAWRLEAFAPVFEAPVIPLGILAGCFAMFGTGLVDDIRPVSAPAKLAGGVLAGTIFVLAGTSIIYFRLPFVGFTVLSPDLSAVLTVVWVLGMSTVVNFADGLDGLAAGIVAIAAGAFLVYSEALEGIGGLDTTSPGPLVAVLALGLCLGFLPWNFHPASIFMGDSGALLLGTLMAASTISVGGQSDDPFIGQAWFFFAPIAIPLLILGVPILDTVWSILRRARRRTGVAVADKNHIHHRLIDLGHGHRRTVLILWGWTTLLSSFVLYPVVTGRANALIPIGAASLVLLLFTLLGPRAIRATRSSR